MKIRSKLLILFLLLGLLPALIISFISSNSASHALEQEAFALLNAKNNSKKEEIQRYFQVIENQLLSLAESTMTLEMAKEMKETFKSMPKEAGLIEDQERLLKSLRSYYTSQFDSKYQNINGKSSNVNKLLEGISLENELMQAAYIAENPFPLGEKHKMNPDNPNSKYSKAHQHYHPRFRAFLERFGYYDIFLVNPEDGVIFYSVFKELDYATSLKTGPYKDSGIARCFNRALAIKTGDKTAFDDFVPYLPSYEAYASFIGFPVRDQNRKVVAVLIFQMPIDKINEIMHERSGMGKTGDSFLCGEDDAGNLRLKSSRPLQEADVGDSVEGQVAQDIAGANSILTESVNGSGTDVFLSADSVSIYGRPWHIASQIHSAEALHEVTSLRYFVIALLLASLVVIVVIAIFYANSIGKPIINCVHLAEEISLGDLSNRLNESGKDEIASLSKALNKMSDSLSRKEQLAQAISKGDLTGEVQLASEKDTLGKALKEMSVSLREMVKTMGTRSSGLVAMAEELSAVSSQLVSGAEGLRARSTNVAGATEELSTSISTMASGAEEMSANAQSVATATTQMSQSFDAVTHAVQDLNRAMNEVAHNAKQSSNITLTARERAQTASNTMDELGTSAKEIGQVTEVIKRIAQQTNLLALNATIEAASAGDAGKGFAVVANEIKDLASQSAQAAEDIAQRIGGIQTSSQSAVEAIRSVTDTIEQATISVQNISETIAKQVQNTNEISANITQANSATSNIANAISEVATGANDISKNAGEASSAANEVSENIQHVNDSADESASGARQVKESSDELTQTATELNGLVEHFSI